jgi:hypothetical protein
MRTSKLRAALGVLLLTCTFPLGVGALILQARAGPAGPAAVASRDAPGAGASGRGRAASYVVQVQAFEAAAGSKARACSPTRTHELSDGGTEKGTLSVVTGPPVLGDIKYLQKLFLTLGEPIRYTMRVREAGADRVRLDLTLEQTDSIQSDESGTLSCGRTLRAQRRMRVGRAERFTLHKDAEGRPVRWVEVVVILAPGPAVGP